MKESKGITNRILRTELVPWKKLEWLQPPGLKQISKEKFDKLKASLKNNDFIQPFNIWDENGKLWILDGHHRRRAMEEMEREGFSIPELLPGNYIECSSRKEAAKLVLVYSAIYADITKEGLSGFIGTEGLDIDDLKLEIDLPQFDLGSIGGGSMSVGDAPEEYEELKPYQRTHILLSFPPSLFVKLQPHLKEILAMEGVEYEQGSN